MKRSDQLVAVITGLTLAFVVAACGHAVDRRAAEIAEGPGVMPETDAPPVVPSADATGASEHPPVRDAREAAASQPTVGSENLAKAKQAPAVAQRSVADSERRVLSSMLAGGSAPSVTMAMRGGAVPTMMAPDFNTEQYASIQEEGFVAVSDRPLSTFSIDVDTASYSNVRRFLAAGTKPPSGAVRIEELLNYFTYDYPAPSGSEPFSVTTEVSSAPWDPRNKLVLVGLRGRSVELDRVPPRNLVFLIDVSGSMMAENKLPLVKNALSELARQMRPKDHAGIVVYAGASGCVLEPTTGEDKQKILDAIGALEAGGSTNGADGIRLAYQLAAKHFDRTAINRVILATDGDFNVGTTSESDLVQLIEDRRKGGVFLTVLGVGEGNLKDSTMEQLADHGNGNYAYLDSPAEARRVLLEQASATLMTIAKDVKIQIEFNPVRAKAYRLIGYENRRLQAKDFNDDAKDAGEIGAGHTVTALYEVVPSDADADTPSVDPLRYQQPGEPTGEARKGNELLTVKLRYKQPDGDISKLKSVAVNDGVVPIEKSSTNLRFASGVATFGMVLRGSEERGSASYDMALSLARDALGQDPNAYRAEFLRMIAMAKDLDKPGADGGPVTP